MVVSSHDGGRSGGGVGADDGCGGRHAGRREVKKYFNYFNEKRRRYISNKLTKTNVMQFTTFNKL